MNEEEEKTNRIPLGMFGFYTDVPEVFEQRVAEIEADMDEVDAGIEDPEKWIQVDDFWAAMREEHPWLDHSLYQGFLGHQNESHNSEEQTKISILPFYTKIILRIAWRFGFLFVPLPPNLRVLTKRGLAPDRKATP